MFSVMINYDNNYILSICKLLDKGLKFVPNNLMNIFDVYDNMYKELDNSMVQFNSFISTSNQNMQTSTSQIMDHYKPNFPNQVFQNTISSNPFNKINKNKINFQNIQVQSETIHLRNDILSDFNKIMSNINNKTINDTNNLP